MRFKLSESALLINKLLVKYGVPSFSLESSSYDMLHEIDKGNVFSSLDEVHTTDDVRTFRSWLFVYCLLWTYT